MWSPSSIHVLAQIASYVDQTCVKLTLKCGHLKVTVCSYTHVFIKTLISLLRPTNFGVSLEPAEYLFVDFINRVFFNCFMKRKVKFCELNVYIIKEFMRIILFSFYKKIFFILLLILKRLKSLFVNSIKGVF